MRISRLSFAALGLSGALLVACGKKEEPAPPPPAAQPPPAPALPSLSAISLGKGIGSDMRITAPADTFSVRDTIYVSVATTGAAENTKLKAMWMMGSEKVSTDSVMLNLSGPAQTEFHIARPKAWPKGLYQVTITLNDGASMARSFVVK
jgi:hypothetical protein